MELLSSLEVFFFFLVQMVHRLMIVSVKPGEFLAGST